MKELGPAIVLFVFLLIGLTLILDLDPARAGDAGALTGSLDILLDAGNAFDKKAMERPAGTSNEYLDALSKETKDAIVRIAAMRNTRLAMGGLIRNVWTREYFISLYAATINGEAAAIGLLWGDARLLTSVVFLGEDLKDLQGALRRGPESTTMVLRDYYLTRHIDIDPTLSIVGELTAISPGGLAPDAGGGDIAHIDLVPEGDKEKATDYIERIYEKAVRVTDLKENVLVGSALVSIYGAIVDDRPTGALFFFYRRTEEGAFEPLRDPAATWRSGWLDNMLRRDPETRQFLLTDLLRDICVDPNAPRSIPGTGEPVEPVPQEQRMSE